jgi:hypothetical protein
MATQTANITALYEDVVADLIPYYDNFVLLPNPSIILNSYNISGGVGNTMKIPLVNSWTTANSSLSDNEAILGTPASVADPVNDFIPESVSLGVNKRGTGTVISEESLEDGGFETVRNAVVTRLSRALAQSTDKAGMEIIATGSETAATSVNDLTNNDGYSNTTLSGLSVDCSVVFSPEAVAYAVKRDPSVKIFNDVNSDNYQMVATLRNGFAQLRTDFIRTIATSGAFDANSLVNANLNLYSESIARLREANAPTDGSGFYLAVVSAPQELALAKSINGVGGISSGAIGSVSQDLANQALLEGMIGQAIGARFIRSNNLPGFTEA